MKESTGISKKKSPSVSAQTPATGLGALPPDDRPYEKCQKYGPAALTDRELLAVLLRSGIPGIDALDLASSLLGLAERTAWPGLQGLVHLSMEELRSLDGIGTVKAIQLKCIAELSMRIARSGSRSRLCFTMPSTIADYYMEQLRHEEQEIMLVMMLDTKGGLLGDPRLTRGTVNMTLVTPREIFIEAMRYHAVSIILVHNHPSGDPSPSHADIALTRNVCGCGQMMGISLLDHVIIGDHRYCSFKEEGLMDQIQTEGIGNDI
ncbi:MAG: DNA repair protein RadC [Blautia sp.]|nr:DNA repair protein RadC [Blautia sp.]